MVNIKFSLQLFAATYAIDSTAVPFSGTGTEKYATTDGVNWTEIDGNQAVLTNIVAAYVSGTSAGEGTL
ncbi:MAG: hypothetical protein IJQ78_08260, partial [Selenomonadaceae bacterium]|nr:hypothetical protein [Selenomonadaceae bacterium]